MGFPSDLAIARQAQLKPIEDVAGEMGLGGHLLEAYGRDVLKIRLEAVEELADRPKAKYVVVSAITPTPLGEGKTTTTVGLGQAMRHIGRRATVAIRQPSMGPTFGIKGGAAGGGYSQVVPMEILNLHLTGDFHAVTSAHNMLSAVLDNHLFQGNECGIDQHRISWRRVLDVNDRVLRNIIVGLGTRFDGIPRQTGFDITAASEVMAIFALTRSLVEMRERMGRYPSAFGYLLCALDFYLSSPREIALIGAKTDSEMIALIRAIYSDYWPNKVIALAAEGDERSTKAVALLASRPKIDGKPTAYVCQGYTCLAPGTTPEQLISQLNAE